MPFEIRDADDATRWLSGGFCLMRLTDDVLNQIPVVSRWAFSILSESGMLPPVGVIGDVGQIIGGTSLKFVAEPSTSPELQQAVHSYEDQFLGRLAADPRLDAVCDAIARLPVNRRGDAVPLLVARMLERIKYQASVSMSPGIARRATEMVGTELIEAGFEVLRQPGDTHELLTEGYQGLVFSARRSGALLADTDVFLLENLTVLDSLTQRLAIEQMVEVSQELSRALPRRLKPKNTASRGRTPTHIEDEDQYPIGGFSSISTSGTLENLVSSELIYMDEGEPEDIDLFDMRYVEGELLFYTRDESVFVRNRRVLTFAITPELSRARFKDTGVPWQRLVIVFGLIACTVRRLTDWLSEQGLKFRVVFIHDQTRSTPLKAEKGLSELLLREWIEKEMCEIDEAPIVEDVLYNAAEAARMAQSDVVFLTMGALELPEVDPRVRVATLNLKEAAPTLWWHDRPAGARVAEGPEAWASWTTATLDLLQEVI